MAGKGRLTEPKRVKKEETGKGMYRVCLLVPEDLQKALPYRRFSSQDGLAKSHLGCQMVPWRSPVSLREEAFVFTPEMQMAQFLPTAHKRSNKVT